jgi:hypothetical protein
MLAFVPPIRLLAGAALVMLLGACGGREGSTVTEFSCVGPFLDTIPPDASSVAAEAPVSPGDSLTLYGHGYTTTCNDTGGNDPLQSSAPVHLTVSWPGGDTEQLGTFTPAGDDMGFSVVVQVPVGTPPGVAKIRDDEQDAVTYRFHVR